MAKGKAPVVVTITKTKHKDQPHTVTIDKPGRSEPYKLKQRYSKASSGKRGALRNLKAMTHGVGCEPSMVPCSEWNYTTALTWYHEGREIKFVIVDKTKTSK